MSEEAAAQVPASIPPAPRRQTFRVILLAILALIALVMLGPVGLRIGWELLTGWWGFLQRVVPLVVARADQLPAFVFTLGVVLGGLHWFLGWLRKHQRSIADGGSEKPPWRFRWTSTIAGLIAASTLMAMAGIGIIHQTGWMLTSDEPAWVYRTGGVWAGRVADRLWQEGVLAGTNQAHEGFGLEAYREQWAKDYRVFKLVGDQEQLQGVIVWRRPEGYGPDIIVVTELGKQQFFKAHELPKVMELYRSRMRPVW